MKKLILKPQYHRLRKKANNQVQLKEERNFELPQLNVQKPYQVLKRSELNQQVLYPKDDLTMIKHYTYTQKSYGRNASSMENIRTLYKEHRLKVKQPQSSISTTASVNNINFSVPSKSNHFRSISGDMQINQKNKKQTYVNIVELRNDNQETKRTESPFWLNHLLQKNQSEKEIVIDFSSQFDSSFTKSQVIKRKTLLSRYVAKNLNEPSKSLSDYVKEKAYNKVLVGQQPKVQLKSLAQVINENENINSYSFQADKSLMRYNPSPIQSQGGKRKNSSKKDDNSVIVSYLDNYKLQKIKLYPNPIMLHNMNKNDDVAYQNDFQQLQESLALYKQIMKRETNKQVLKQESIGKRILNILNNQRQAENQPIVTRSVRRKPLLDILFVKAKVFYNLYKPVINLDQSNQTWNKPKSIQFTSFHKQRQKLIDVPDNELSDQSRLSEYSYLSDFTVKQSIDQQIDQSNVKPSQNEIFIDSISDISETEQTHLEVSIQSEMENDQILPWQPENKFKYQPIDTGESQALIEAREFLRQRKAQKEKIKQQEEESIKQKQDELFQQQSEELPKQNILSQQSTGSFQKKRAIRKSYSTQFTMKKPTGKNVKRQESQTPILTQSNTTKSFKKSQKRKTVKKIPLNEKSKLKLVTINNTPITPTIVKPQHNPLTETPTQRFVKNLSASLFNTLTVVLLSLQKQDFERINPKRRDKLRKTQARYIETHTPKPDNTYTFEKQAQMTANKIMNEQSTAKLQKQNKIIKQQSPKKYSSLSRTRYAPQLIIKKNQQQITKVDNEEYEESEQSNTSSYQEELKDVVTTSQKSNKVQLEWNVSSRFTKLIKNKEIMEKYSYRPRRKQQQSVSIDTDSSLESSSQSEDENLSPEAIYDHQQIDMNEYLSMQMRLRQQMQKSMTARMADLILKGNEKKQQEKVEKVDFQMVNYNEIDDFMEDDYYQPSQLLQFPLNYAFGQNIKYKFSPRAPNAPLYNENMLNDYIEPDQVNMKSAQLKKHFKAKLIKYLIGEINEIKNPIKLLPEQNDRFKIKSIQDSLKRKRRKQIRQTPPCQLYGRPQLTFSNIPKSKLSHHKRFQSLPDDVILSGGSHQVKSDLQYNERIYIRLKNQWNLQYFDSFTQGSRITTYPRFFNTANISNSQSSLGF